MFHRKQKVKSFLVLSRKKVLILCGFPVFGLWFKIDLAVRLPSFRAFWIYQSALFYAGRKNYST